MFFLDFLDRHLLPFVARGLSAEGGIGLWRQMTESDDSKKQRKNPFLLWIQPRRFVVIVGTANRSPPYDAMAAIWQWDGDDLSISTIAMNRRDWICGRKKFFLYFLDCHSLPFVSKGPSARGGTSHCCRYLSSDTKGVAEEKGFRAPLLIIGGKRNRGFGLAESGRIVAADPDEEYRRRYGSKVASPSLKLQEMPGPLGCKKKIKAVLIVGRRRSVPVTAILSKTGRRCPSRSIIVGGSNIATAEE